MMLVGVMVHLCARERVDRGRGQGNMGPVGPVGFRGFGAGLGLFLLPTFSTFKGALTKHIQLKRL